MLLIVCLSVLFLSYGTTRAEHVERSHPDNIFRHIPAAHNLEVSTVDSVHFKLISEEIL